MSFEHGLTIGAASSLLIYHQLSTWGPFFPWNDTEKLSQRDILIDASFNGMLMGTALYCLLKENSGFFHSFPLIYYPFLFAGECLDWWIPYFSPRFAKARKIWDYDTRYSRTLKWIPHKAGTRTPDANHTLLHLLTLLTLIVVYMDRFR